MAFKWLGFGKTQVGNGASGFRPDPELAHYFIAPSASDLARGLESWSWLVDGSLQPVAVTAFGDVFLRSSNEVLLLDTIEGVLSPAATSPENLNAVLRVVEEQDRLLLGGLVDAAIARGLTLAPDEAYDFRVAPRLGGEMSVEAMHRMNFVVKLNIAGQLHDQVRNLAPGARISGVTISDT